MRPRNQQRGTTIRVVVGTLCAVFFLPIMIFVGALFTYQRTNAQQALAREAEQRARAEANRARAIVAEQRALAQAVTPSGGREAAVESFSAGDAAATPPAGYRRRTRTVVEEQTRQVPVTVVDPTTGEYETTYREERVTVPRMVVEYYPVKTPSHSDSVLKLIEQLRTMGRDDDGRDEKLAEVKELLKDEFAQQHEKQAAEIANTEARLESVKKMHQQREENRDRIIQRRIDELLGEPNELDWYPNERGTSVVGAVPLGAARTGLPMPRLDADSTIGRLDYFPPTPTPTPTPTQRSTKSTNAPRLPGVTLVQPAPTSVTANPRNTSRSLGAVGPGPGVNPGSTASTRRIEVSTSGDRNVFDLARRLSTSVLSEAAARSELDRTRELRDRGAVTSSEVRKRELELNQATNDSRLLRAQWKALGDGIRRDIQFAESELERAHEHAQRIRVGVKEGRISQQELTKVESVLEQKRKAYDDLAAQHDQMKDAEDLIDLPKLDEDGETIEGDDDASESNEDSADAEAQSETRVAR